MSFVEGVQDGVGGAAASVTGDHFDAFLGMRASAIAACHAYAAMIVALRIRSVAWIAS